MKKNCDMARLFKAALKTGRAGALVLGAVAALAGCTTTNGANAAASREAELGKGLGVGEDLRLWELLYSGDDLDRFSTARLDLFLYTLGDFFLACREGGMDKARAAGAAEAVVFDDPYTTRFFKLGWKACADDGVDTVASGKKWEEITRQVEADPDIRADVQTRVEVKLLETLIPLIWRDDYEGFLSVAMRWAPAGSPVIIARFERSPSWTGWDKLAAFWAGMTEGVAGEWEASTEALEYYDLARIKHFSGLFTAIADFLAAARERGIANVDVNTIAFEGLEGRYTTEYFRAGLALIQRVTDKDARAAALDKLWFETLARLDLSSAMWEFLEELGSLKAVLTVLAEEDPHAGNVSLGKFLFLAEYFWCSPEAYDAIAARFPGVTPVAAW